MMFISELLLKLIAMDGVPNVDIDDGVFKYVYIRVYEDAPGDDR